MKFQISRNKKISALAIIYFSLIATVSILGCENNRAKPKLNQKNGPNGGINPQGIKTGSELLLFVSEKSIRSVGFARYVLQTLPFSLDTKVIDENICKENQSTDPELKKCREFIYDSAFGGCEIRYKDCSSLGNGLLTLAVTEKGLSLEGGFATEKKEETFTFKLNFSSAQNGIIQSQLDLTAKTFTHASKATFDKTLNNIIDLSIRTKPAVNEELSRSAEEGESVAEFEMTSPSPSPTPTPSPSPAYSFSLELDSKAKMTWLNECFHPVGTISYEMREKTKVSKGTLQSDEKNLIDLVSKKSIQWPDCTKSRKTP